MSFSNKKAQSYERTDIDAFISTKEIRGAAQIPIRRGTGDSPEGCSQCALNIGIHFLNGGFRVLFKINLIREVGESFSEFLDGHEVANSGLVLETVDNKCDAC